MLQLAIYDAPGGQLLLDASHLAHDVQLATNEHGFESLTATLAMPLAPAFALWDRPGLPHVVVSGPAADVVWEGRLEDVALTDGGVALTALGYWRALSDVPYTAVWAWTALQRSGNLNGWSVVEAVESAIRDPSRYSMTRAMDPTTGGMLVRPVSGQLFSANNRGAWTFETPVGSVSQIARMTFNYTIKAPANWIMRIAAFTRDYAGGGATEWYLEGNGGTQTGSASVTLATPRDRIIFEFYYNTTEARYNGETGDIWARVGQVAITGTTATITADAIVRELVAYVNSINPTQLSASTRLIQTPGVTLTDELYDDELPSDICTKLAGLGDNQTPPRAWETGVWEAQRLHFRPRGSQGRAWFVDVTALQIERTLDSVANAVYAVYQRPTGGLQRTATTTEARSIARWGLTRRAALQTQTTDATLAAVHRDAHLADRAAGLPRAGIAFAAVYDSAGGQWPLWAVRSGDTITIRNLPPTLSADVDRLRTFRISRTEYDAVNAVLTVEPEAALPRLEVLVARLGEGL